MNSSAINGRIQLTDTISHITGGLLVSEVALAEL